MSKARLKSLEKQVTALPVAQGCSCAFLSHATDAELDERIDTLSSLVHDHTANPMLPADATATREARLTELDRLAKSRMEVRS